MTTITAIGDPIVLVGLHGFAVDCGLQVLTDIIKFLGLEGRHEIVNEVNCNDRLFAMVYSLFVLFVNQFSHLIEDLVYIDIGFTAALIEGHRILFG